MSKQIIDLGEAARAEICKWCGCTRDEHVTAHPNGLRAKTPCGLLKSGFVAAIVAKPVITRDAAAERAAVVKYLRGGLAIAQGLEFMTLQYVADAIERGEHVR